MNAHPDEDLVFRYLAGEATEQDRLHLLHCLPCSLECERFDGAFAAFRGTVRRWTDCELAAGPIKLHAPSDHVAGGPWIMAFLLFLALAGLKVALDGNSIPVKQTPADHTKAFLDFVSNDVAQPVPTGMEPLLTLVTR